MKPEKSEEQQLKEAAEELANNIIETVLNPATHTLVIFRVDESGAVSSLGFGCKSCYEHMCSLIDQSLELKVIH